MNFAGIPIYSNPLLFRTETRRVPGGYLNRWLIRAQVTVPYAVHDIQNGRIFAHPTLVAELKLLAAINDYAPRGGRFS